jgi:hypothetical protein
VEELRPTEPSTTTEREGRRLDTSSEWFWPAVNLIGLLAVVGVNALANIVPFNGMTTGEVVNRDPVYFQPAGWTFSIWSLIYLLLAAYVVYSFLPVGRADARTRRIAPVFLASNIFNALWLVLWHWERWLASTVMLAGLALSLLVIYGILRRGRRAGAQPGAIERLMVWTPFSVYLGWASIALLANIAVWMDRNRIDLWGMDGRWTAITFMLIALVATALMAIWQRDPTYALVIVWALVGIVAFQWDRSRLVSISAVVVATVAAGLAVFGSLLAFEMRHISIAPVETPPERSGWNPFRRRSPSEAREDGHTGADRSTR